MSDKDIDFSDLPEIPPEMFAQALVRKGLKPTARKSQVTLRIDADVSEQKTRAEPGGRCGVKSR
jgi:hypothetical protein